VVPAPERGLKTSSPGLWAARRRAQASVPPLGAGRSCPPWRGAAARAQAGAGGWPRAV